MWKHHSMYMFSRLWNQSSVMLLCTHYCACCRVAKLWWRSVSVSCQHLSWQMV